MVEVQIAPSSLWALVDMGSNGIRFSITDLTAATARCLPVVFQERLGISLYDAQFSTGQQQPIPQNVIHKVLNGLRRFKTVCADYGVPEQQIKVLATEATRNATNSQDYRNQIYTATGWTVDLLQSEDEGGIGALGIASSFENLDGLLMDLGGGSTQVAWMNTSGDTGYTRPKRSISFPYGAAALTKLLDEIDAGPHPHKAREELKKKIEANYTAALESLELPPALRQRVQDKSMTLYLSGGGFRGWGYILMSTAKKGPYPIPIINGYIASAEDFKNIEVVAAAAKAAYASGKDGKGSVFRISKRRAAQVPAVSFLVDAIMKAFPFIHEVRFCQGGVREGYLFKTLPSELKIRAPLSSATIPLSPDPASAVRLASLLATALPENSTILERRHAEAVRTPLLISLAHTMYEQRRCPKESASVSALYLPITGPLASAHGISHADRALLGIALCERWGGERELPPPHDDFLARLQTVLTKQEVWWARYIGTVAAFLGDMYPSGRIHPKELQSDAPSRVSIISRWADGLGKKGNQQGIALEIKVQQAAKLGSMVVADHIEKIEKMGKKKNRVGGSEYGYGVAIEVDFEWV